MEEAEPPGSGNFPPKSSADAVAATSSDELDHIPLRRRRIMLLQKRPNTPMSGIRFKEEEEVHGCNLPIYNQVRILDDSMNVAWNGSNDDIDSGRKLDANICASPLSSVLPESPPKVQVAYPDKLCHSVAVKNETCDDLEDDHLDHIVLRERQRMLLIRKVVGLEKPVLEQEPVEGREKIHAIEEALPAKTQFDSTHDNYTEVVPKSESVNLPYDDKIPSSRNSTESSSLDTNVASLSAAIEVKGEAREEICHNFYSNAKNNEFPFKSMVKAKSETSELDEDKADGMCLRDRLKLRRPVETDQPNPSKNFEFSNKSTFYGVNRLRKRKKTATDSVKTALEEDAPGLLQVLVEEGVSLDEIRLYGETEDDEPIDESFGEDTFPELESVTSKGIYQAPSFFKFAQTRSSNGEKPSYCLAALLSLVEQSRYLQFRKWPVEWGWCRDLQSFLFVFERHNRIVLERPEYGYATYFFELDSSTVEWQVKRLVTAMKLTICSRVSLIENKSLTVGDDLSAGEAKVLIRYGWVPNSGLGTMLNYRNRVVHDRMNDNDVSEWRSKIRKLLLDGYNGGTLASTNVADDVLDAEIKLEQEL